MLICAKIDFNISEQNGFYKEWGEGFIFQKLYIKWDDIWVFRTKYKTNDCPLLVFDKTARFVRYGKAKGFTAAKKFPLVGLNLIITESTV